MIAAILAILNAIPTLNSWFQALALAWAAKQLADHNTDFATAHIALIKNNDQSLLESAEGSVNAGKTGTDTRDLVDGPADGSAP